MWHYRFYEEHCILFKYGWMVHFEKSNQVALAKIVNYTPCDWRMYYEGNDSGHTDRYNQGLLEWHANPWDEGND
jgi:hypothetical protein